MAKEEKRFTEISEEGHGMGNVYLTIRDNQTGVNYLFMKNGMSAGLTPLIDKDGKPIITEAKKSNL